MGLSRKTTISKACPNCGKEHELTFYNIPHLYLDCSPALQMSKFTQRIVICTECGLVYFYEDEWLLNAEAAIAQPEYQTALNAEYVSEAEKKLVLLGLLYEFEFVPLYLAHLYRELKNTTKESEWLDVAIKNIQNGADAVCDAYPRHEFKNLHFDGELCISPEMRLVDLYRRTEQFENAKECADKLIKSLDDNPEDVPCQAYLQRELNLIQKRDNTPQ